MNTELIDYDKCREYARALCGSYGIPECDVADIGSDAYLLSIRRSWRAAPGENEEAVARRLMYTSVINVINRRNKRSTRALSDAEDLYRTSTGEAPSDDEIVEERFAANDGEDAASRIADSLDWQNPFWLRLFNYERKKLQRERRKSSLANLSLHAIKAGLKDSRFAIVREKLNVSGLRFCAILNFLKVRFDLCFQALRAWRD